MKTMRGALQGSGLTITAELSLQRQATADEALRQAEILAPAVDAIQVAENPHDCGQVAPLAMCSLLLRQGIDPVPHISCRDRNRIALQSDLLGLRAMGVSSLLLNEGNHLPVGPRLAAKPVFDINCQELVAMANALSEEEWGEAMHEFVIGTSVTVNPPEPGWTAEQLLAKASAGARFLQTQPCFDAQLLSRYVQALVDAKVTWSYSVIVTLAPLPSADTARWLIENSHGTLIPGELIQRLDNAGDPEQEGIDICAELIGNISTLPGVSGINLLTLDKPETVVATIEQSAVVRSE